MAVQHRGWQVTQLPLATKALGSEWRRNEEEMKNRWPCSLGTFQPQFLIFDPWRNFCFFPIRSILFNSVLLSFYNWIKQYGANTATKLAYLTLKSSKLLTSKAFYIINFACVFNRINEKIILDKNMSALSTLTFMINNIGWYTTADDKILKLV
jgi:hypothetical protein